jgi:hypothetical protein
MLRFLGTLVLLAGAFGLGYMYGTRPLGNFEQTVKDVSRNVLDTTMGIERDLRRRQGLVDAKARIVQAKSDLFQKHTNDAAKELAEAVDSLENATRGGKQADPNVQVRELTGKIRQMRLDLSQGKKIPASTLDEIQKEVDDLLSK